MNTFSWRRIGVIVLLSLGLLSWALPPASAAAPDTEAPTGNAAAGVTKAAKPAEAAANTSDSDDADDPSDEPESDTRHHESYWQDHEWHRHRTRHHHGDAVVSIGHDSHLSAGRHADAVVSILGSSLSEGDAENVVAVLGDTRIMGPVGDNAVAVLGNVYIDSKVAGNAVAVGGNVELGPDAEISGNVTSVLGTVLRDPAAIVHGGEESVFAGTLGDVDWLHTWIKHCLIYGRPLSLAPGLAWAWTVALGFLALYIGLALLFGSALSRCVETLETQPGRTTVAAILAMLLIPVLFVLLCVTVVGIAVVPFVAAALFCAALFGKAVVLAAIGRRVVGNRPAPWGHPALAVLIGGAIVLALYLVPVLGFIVYKLLGLFGLGAIVYTLILRLRAHQSAADGAPPPERPHSFSAGPDFAATHAVGPESAAPFARRPSPDGCRMARRKARCRRRQSRPCRTPASGYAWAPCCWISC